MNKISDNLDTVANVFGLGATLLLFIQYAISGNLFGLIALNIPLGMLWFFYCTDRSINERRILMIDFGIEIIGTITSVKIRTHVWRRMTLRNPWKLYRFDCE